VSPYLSIKADLMPTESEEARAFNPTAKPAIEIDEVVF
jgi:hypothetical protein